VKRHWNGAQKLTKFSPESSPDLLSAENKSFNCNNTAPAYLARDLHWAAGNNIPTTSAIVNRTQADRATYTTPQLQTNMFNELKEKTNSTV